MDEGRWGGEGTVGILEPNKKNKAGDVMVGSCRRIAIEGDDLEPKVGWNSYGPEKDSFILPTDFSISNSQVLHCRRTYPFVKVHFLLQIVLRCYVFRSQINRVIIKSLCTWLLQYIKLQVMFRVSPASLQTFIDTPNCVLEDRVQYSTVQIPNGHLQLINCVYCNRQVHRDVLITLYI
jgi:hypothetical protein